MTNSQNIRRDDHGVPFTMEDSACGERQLDEARTWFREVIPILMLVDIFLMFASLVLIFNVLWIQVIIQLSALAYTIFVLHLAYRATKVIPPSIPFQRPCGVVFYIAAHIIQYFIPGQAPLPLVAILFFAVPLSMLFLFNE